MYALCAITSHPIVVFLISKILSQINWRNSKKAHFKSVMLFLLFFLPKCKHPEGAKKMNQAKKKFEKITLSV